MSGFAPLREEAEKRGKLIKAASERHAPPDEACKLIGSFGQSEIKMIKYIEANSANAEFRRRSREQLKAGHKNTEAMLKKVCAVAQQAQMRSPDGPSLNEVLGRRGDTGRAGRRLPLWDALNRTWGRHPGQICRFVA